MQSLSKYKSLLIALLCVGIIVAVSSYAIFVLSDQNLAGDTNQVSEYSPSSSKEKKRILIVPGHEPEYGGTGFSGYEKSYYENDLVVDISETLAQDLSQNSQYEVIVARTKTEWNPILQTYFDEQEETVEEWKQEKKQAIKDATKEGEYEKVDTIEHIKASDEAAYHLYAVTKWSNENKIDLALHVHLNDYPRKKPKTPGVYTGFSIYIPESQYGNFAPSQEFAQYLKTALQESFSASNLKIEEDVIIEAQDLIAVGRYDTAEFPSVVIEYGYIYEPYFKDEESRREVGQTISDKTVKAVDQFFK